ncbi:MAG: tetratricopeptide repeat protein [Lewinellaceae bacterium]|nr:tetratricopeptide repeat protein [Lewinellaceae bacterium]
MKNVLLFCFLVYLSPLQAQEPMLVEHGCNFAAADNEAEYYTYDPSAEAEQIVERIMQMSVLPQNFIIKSADCKNALATTQGKQRYILYSTAFLENFKKEANTKWAAYCVLAHEIGHHLSNHDLEQTDASLRKRYELEADKFAGGVLYRLGATLEEAQAGIRTFALEGASQTHPPKRARLEAVAVGWKQAEELAAEADNAIGSAAPDSKEKKLYQQALEEKNNSKALELLDEAIALNEGFADAYLERGRRRIDWLREEPEEEDEDYEEPEFSETDILEDLDAYLSMRPKDSKAHVLRGDMYRFLREHDKALDEYNLAIRLDGGNAEAYLSRAIYHMGRRMTTTNSVELAEKDFAKAVELAPGNPEVWFHKGYFRFSGGEYEAAIADFNKTLELAPAEYDALDLRATSFYFLKRYGESLSDFNRMQALNPKKFNDEFTRGICYQHVGKHREAIADFDLVIEKSISGGDAYIHRGVSKRVLGQKEAAYEDYLQGLENDFSVDVYVAKNITLIGCLLCETGLADEGLDWLNSVLAEYPNQEDALACKQKVELKTGKKANPGHAPKYYLYLKNYVQAIDQQKKYFSNSSDAYLKLCRSALFAGAYKKSIEAGLEALKKDPGNTMAEAYLAPAYLLHNEYAKAETLYKKWKGKKFKAADAETANALFLKDIAELEASGFSHPDFKKVKTLLK